jgi:NACalpha-BTF3-like transcription factor
MDKKLSSQFMTAAGNFITHGGTLIMLAHVNKNRSAEGKVIAGGTSDISDDANCVYTLDEVEGTSGVKRVLFENTKCRGDVAKTAGYSHSVAEGETYLQKLESVQALDDTTTDRLETDMKLTERLARDKYIIESITDAIIDGKVSKTELIDFVMDDIGISRQKARKALADYEGSNKEKGHLWRFVTGTRNVKSYELL